MTNYPSEASGAIGYRWASAEATPANGYLLPVVQQLLQRYALFPVWLFDLDCEKIC